MTPILLNAFGMNCVGHIDHGLRTHPRDRSGDNNDLAHRTEGALRQKLFGGGDRLPQRHPAAAFRHTAA